MSTVTVARWIKSLLSSVGRDASVFKAHSVWSVSVTNTHMHVKGVPVVEILRASYWTNEHTFRKFHLREHIVLE